MEFYKSLAVDLDEKLELKANENEGLRLQVDHLLGVEADLLKKIEKLNYHIERTAEMHEKTIERQQNSYNEIVDAQRRQIKVLDEE